MNKLIEKVRQYGIRRFILFALAEVKLVVVNRWFLGSYSQVKEDIILDRLIGYKRHGFYIDIGAYDPYRFSNTMRFYRRGWRGINIEPDTTRWQRFVADRPGDCNLNVGVADTKGNLTYYRIDPATLSTFDKNQALSYKKQGFSIIETVRVPVVPMRDILQKYAKGKIVDFLSVDVEGMEMRVLSSNDWKKIRPRYICIESADYTNTKKGQKNYENIEDFLRGKGYKKVFNNGLNSFYKDAAHG